MITEKGCVDSNFHRFAPDAKFAAAPDIFVPSTPNPFVPSLSTASGFV
jgi:hypothetical protein